MNNQDRTRWLVMVLANGTGTSASRCNQLAMAGYRTIQIDNLDEAVYAVEHEHPDVVFIMPPVGNQMAEDWPAVLRRVQPLAYLPILVQTPTGDDAMQCTYMERGADCVISTQTSAKELIARMRAMLRVKDVHDELSASRQDLQDSLRRERELMNKLKQDNAGLLQQCSLDPLTHAANVESFRQLLEHEFQVAKRYGQPLSLLMLDIDRFKGVNDTYGHPCGDLVLKEIAGILKRAMRQADVVARTGGEEFGIILPQTDATAAGQLGQRIRQEIEQTHFRAYGQDVHVTLSVGAATYPADAEIIEPRMMEYLADQCLLWAKQHGRNRMAALGKLRAPARQRLRRQYLGIETPQGAGTE